MPLSFIHTADLHLGRGLDYLPDNSLVIYEHLLKIIEETAVKNNVSFILFAGDTFNSLNVDISIKKRFLNLIKNVGKQGIEIFYACGNHDFYSEDFYKTFLKEKNFNMFPGKWKKFERDDVAIHGYSFDKAAFKERMLQDYTDVISGKTNIFCFHTNISEISSEHENYAPSKIQDYEKFPENTYFALGHIHQQSFIKEIKPTVFYSGSPLPTRITESGKKGFYLVKQKEDQSFENFLINGGSEIAELSVDISAAEEFFDIENIIKDKTDKYSENIGFDGTAPLFLSFKVILTGKISPELKNELVKNIAGNYFEEEMENIYVKDHTYPLISPEAISDEKGLFEAMVKTYYNVDMDDVEPDKNITEILENDDEFSFEKTRNDALSILYSMIKGDK